MPRSSAQRRASVRSAPGLRVDFSTSVIDALENRVLLDGTAEQPGWDSADPPGSTFVLQLDATGTLLQVWQDVPATSVPTATYDVASSSPIAIQGTDGDDRFILDFFDGNPIPAGGLLLDGGKHGRADTLTVLGNSANRCRYTPGAASLGRGTLLMDQKPIDFTGFESVIAADLAALVFTTPGSQDALSVSSPTSDSSEVKGSSDGVALQPIRFFNTSSLILDTATHDAEAGDDTITISSSGIDAVGLNSFKVNAGAGNNSLIIHGGDFKLDTNAGSDGANLAMLVDNNSTVYLPGSQRLASLTINDSARVNLTGGGASVLRVGNLSLNQSGTLDLIDSNLIVEADAATRGDVLSQITRLIGSARTAPPKHGRVFGLLSSMTASWPRTALAPILNDRGDGSPILGTFEGQGVDANAVLVKYSWNGDANLDGKIDAADYFLIDSGFVTQKGGYRNGDFNFDGAVDAADYFLIDSSFIGQTSILGATIDEPFDSTNGWTGSQAVVSVDTDLAQETGSGSDKGVKLQCTATNDYLYSSITKAVSWNLSSMAGSIRFYIHPGTPGQPDDWDGIDKIILTLRSGGSWNNYVSAYIYNNISNAYFAARPGWHTVPIRMASTNLFSSHGTLDWSAIDGVRISVLRKTAASAPAVTFDDLQLFPVSKRKLVAMNFDDGYATEYNALRYLANLGLPATLYVITGMVGTPVLMPQSQLHELHDAGILIANHTVTHKPQWSLMPPEQKVAEITGAARWLQDHGFGDGARIMAAPGGYWDSINDPSIIETYLDQMRYAAAPEGLIIDAMHNPAEVYSAALYPDDGLRMIATMEASGGLAIVYTHGGDPYLDPTWKAVYDKLKADQDAGLIQVVSMADVLRIT